MLRSMYSGISGMRANQTKIDVIGNNLANSGTTAFKDSDVRFKDMLYQNSGYASSPTQSLGGTNNKQVGLGAQVSSINRRTGQGNAMSTQRALDICIDGDGYLVVCKGDIDGGITVDQATGAGTAATSGGTISQTYYTRDGNLTLDKDGNLVTSDGHRVMGYYMLDGSTPSLKNDSGVLKASFVDAEKKDIKADTTLKPLAIPDTVTVNSKEEPVNKFEISGDGLIIATLGNNQRTVLGQISMASFKNPEGLAQVGGNYLESSANSGAVMYMTGKTATTTGTTTKKTGNQGGFGSIIQGCLEASNVDMTEQFTNMITATKCFQASAKMISNGSEILDTIVSLIR
ncbi:flagellar hook-basal body complex protein [Clostridium sp. BJN0001]|uniref:flagellar hook-basal body protein n=1 Tax=Clostridium sp. BJN0001 TaxID=2930219 RepID=UPI001FD29518|nr:flagellar hook-basal body complex protein [Clostridium sp. BJN0001]